MDKIAQDRGILNKLREQADISGKILERLNPEFSELMDRLRSTDENVRNHAEQVKNLVRSSKSYANRRDYLSAASNISAFHERCRFIAAILKKFIDSVDMKHYKFLLDQFDDEQKQQLFGYDPSRELELGEETSFADDVVITAALKKQADLSDWWFKVTDPLADLAHNLATGRGQAMRALEKRFSISFLKDLKINTHNMVAKTQKFLQFLLGIFKRLAIALSKRNVDQYVEAAKTFISKFAVYHDQFVKYYQKSIVPLKEQHEKLMQAVEEEKARKLEEDAAKERELKKTQEQFVVPDLTQKNAPSDVKSSIKAPEQEEKKMYEPGNLQDLISKEQEENIPLALRRVKSEFIGRIEKFAFLDDPKSLLLEVLAFSEALEDISQDDSLKLLTIAEGMIDDYKTAGIFDFMKNKSEEKSDVKKEPAIPLV